MSRLAREQRHTRRTAQRDGAKVLLKPRPLLRKVLLHRSLVVKRVEVQILVVCHDEDEIRLRRCGGIVDGLGCCYTGRARGCQKQELTRSHA